MIYFTLRKVQLKRNPGQRTTGGEEINIPLRKEKQRKKQVVVYQNERMYYFTDESLFLANN